MVDTRLTSLICLTNAKGDSPLPRHRVCSRIQAGPFQKFRLLKGDTPTNTLGNACCGLQVDARTYKRG